MALTYTELVSPQLADSINAIAGQNLLLTMSDYYENDTYLPEKHAADIFRAQLYVTIIPFIFGMLMIWLVYLLARRLFNTSTALIAAALMAINPVSMLAAQRNWNGI